MSICCSLIWSAELKELDNLLRTSSFVRSDVILFFKLLIYIYITNYINFFMQFRIGSRGVPIIYNFRSNEIWNLRTQNDLDVPFENWNLYEMVDPDDQTS